ncbi:MAG: amidohydrolase [Deltaproteobacteria bacterium]|nr:amidohydrolase [Deltaproteobacteria bacterium]
MNRDIEQADIIIKGGTLLTMADGDSPIFRPWVCIKDNIITDILMPCDDQTAHENAEVIDAENGIILPGLINGHSHTAMTIFRGYADDLPLNKWLFEKIFPAEAKYLNPETVYYGTLLGCAEMIASGCTSVLDGYFFQDSSAKAVYESGMRGLISQGVIDFPAPGVPDPEVNLAIGREFIEKWINITDLITPGLFCHSPVTCSEKTLKKAMEISKEYSIPLQIHLSETTEEVHQIKEKTGLSPVEYLERLGLADKSLIAAHAIHLSDKEIEILAENNVKVVHVPESNMKLSSGVARISEMIERGVIVGIGTDGCASNNNLDLFKEMDMAAKLGKVYSSDPVKMNAETVLKMATRWGACVMGFEDDIGRIEKGMKADIIVVDGHSPHLVPIYNPVSTIVYSAGGPDVKDVIINGKIIMKNREFQTIDTDEIIERVKKIAGKIPV